MVLLAFHSLICNSKRAFYFEPHGKSLQTESLLRPTHSLFRLKVSLSFLFGVSHGFFFRPPLLSRPQIVSEKLQGTCVAASWANKKQSG